MPNRLIVVLLFFLSGCIGFSKTRFSEAQVDGASQRYEKYVGVMHILPTVDLHVEPMNSQSKTLMVFPVPLYESERKAIENTFSIFVSIISKQPEQILAPQDFAYTSLAGARYEPVSMIGPFDCASAQPRPTSTRAPLPPFALAVGHCYTMLVLFEAPLPDPVESFSFSPGTLLSAQGDATLPIVKFAKSTRRNTVAVP